MSSDSDECLIEQGVGTVFGFPGGAVLPIYDELYKRQDRIEHVLTAHEQHAATRPTAMRAPAGARACASPPAAPAPQTW